MEKVAVFPVPDVLPTRALLIVIVLESTIPVLAIIAEQVGHFFKRLSSACSRNMREVSKSNNDFLDLLGHFPPILLT